MTMMKPTEEGGYMRARCDHDDCDVLAPSPGQWIKDNPDEKFPGWNALGWLCQGGTHLCPKHAPTP